MLSHLLSRGSSAKAPWKTSVMVRCPFRSSSTSKHSVYLTRLDNIYIYIYIYICMFVCMYVHIRIVTIHATITTSAAAPSDPLRHSM